jgi:hypothetical protein
MPNATVGADAPASPKSADWRAELNFQRWLEQKQVCERLEDGPATEEQCEAVIRPFYALEHVLQADMGVSVQALGAVLAIEIEDNEPDEPVDGLYRASLRAIRPQLVGSIAEYDDRVLSTATASDKLAMLEELGACERKLRQAREEAIR